MAIVQSLKALGIPIDDPRSTAEGINKLVVPRAQKLKLLREYAVERNIVVIKEWEDLLDE